MADPVPRQPSRRERSPAGGPPTEAAPRRHWMGPASNPGTSRRRPAAQGALFPTLGSARCGADQGRWTSPRRRVGAPLPGHRAVRVGPPRELGRQGLGLRGAGRRDAGAEALLGLPVPRPCGQAGRSVIRATGWWCAGSTP